MKKVLFLSILSGILMGISWPYTGSITLLFFVALIPLFFSEYFITNSPKYSTSTKYLLVALNAFLAFLIFITFSTFWIGYASFAGMVFTELAYALLMTIVFVLFHYTKQQLGTKKGYMSFVFYWIGFEWIHYHWEVSHPWLTFGNVFSITPKFVQWYEYTGVLGGSFWVIIINLSLFFLLLNLIILKQHISQNKALIAFLFFTLTVPIAVSYIIYKRYELPKETINVSVIQPNVDPYLEKFNPETLDSQTNLICNQIRKSKSGKGVDLIVAPETSIAESLLEGSFDLSGQYKTIKECVLEGNATPLLIGASTYFLYPKDIAEKPTVTARKSRNDNWLDFYNTALFMGSTATDIYHKSKLVLGVERVPFQFLLPFLGDFAIDLGGATGSLGKDKEAKNFCFRNICVAPVICYESVYGEYVTDFVRKGANLISIITNDGWWKDTPGYKQHLSYASLRAIETRRTIARSANTGISAFINQKGEIYAATEWDKEEVLIRKVSLNNTITFYVNYGDFIGRVMGGFSLLILLFAIVQKKSLNPN